MADTTEPTAPDFKSDLSALGGDLRTQAHRILRQTSLDAQAQFGSLIEEELQHCLAHFEAAIALAEATQSQQRVAAGLHRNLLFATTPTPTTPQRIGFRESGSEIVYRDFAHPIYDLAEGFDPHFMIGNSERGPVRLRPHYNTRNRLNRIEVEREGNAPVNFTRDQFSLSNLLPEAVGALIWSQNTLQHWIAGSENTGIVRGTFDTRRHIVRQSLDVENRLLAFAANRDVFLLDLRAFLRGWHVPVRDSLLHFYQASSRVGGIALWEPGTSTCWFTTHPDHREIQMGFTAQAYGLELPTSSSAAIALPTALLDGNAFTIEFQYCPPPNPPQGARIPLVGGPGFPSLSWDTAAGGIVFAWQFPGHPELVPIDLFIPARQMVQSGQWMHLAVTREGKKLSFYVNGNHLLSTPIHTHCPLPSAPAALVLGNFRQDGSDLGQIGTFAELRTWSRARTSLEIVEHYATWIVATDAGLPQDLVLYHRFWGPGALTVQAVGSSSFSPEISTAQDLARPAAAFAINQPLIGTGPNTVPFNMPRRFYKTHNRLGNWIATDPRSGTVSWAEQFRDGQWYLMQAPAAGHLPPQAVQVIAAWEAAMVRSPYPVAGDLIAWASQSEGALIRAGYQQQVLALHNARTQVNLAYQALFDALDTAEANERNDATRDDHADAHLAWIAARNQGMRDEVEAGLSEHLATSEALRSAMNIVKSAEAEAAKIKKFAMVKRMTGRP